MKNIKIAAAFLVLTTQAFAQQTPQLGKSPVKEVIAAMTLEEKLNFVKGTGMKISGGEGPIAGSIQGKVPGAAGSTLEIERLGIPSFVVADGPAGLRIESTRKDTDKKYFATAFPVGTLLASTWNPELVKNVGKAIGNEVLEYGVDVLLAPGMNIIRNPLNGRNFEYYSEDPVVSGKIAAGYVDGVQSNGVGVSVKHFVANNQETFRNTINEVIGQRALREIYLKGFEIAIKEAKPWTVMSSYNKINGIYTSESEGLLTDILRKEWGFQGFVMTDWFAGRNYPNQVKAGNDLLMPGRPAEYKKMKAAIEDKELTEADLDKNIEAILNVLVKTPEFKNYKYSDKPDLKAHALVSRQSATEGMVLLKNNGNALPFQSGKIALLGNSSYETIVGGTGSGEVNKAYTVPFYEGLNNAGFTIDTKLISDYKTYIEEERKKQPPRNNILETIKPVDEKSWSISDLQQLAKTTDIAVYTLGRNAGEGSDRKQATDYNLNEKELALIDNISKAFHEQNKKFVVVLNIDAIVDIAKWRDKADAILISWLPGQEAGNAMADVVSGKVNPSGHLTQTLPLSYSDVPSSTTFPGTPKGREDTSVYNEGIYVGYRYYTTFAKPVAYEFGYGLSYSTFEINKLKISAKHFNKSIQVEVTVKNTGKVAGKEVVQLYVSAPGKSMEKPQIELKAFQKSQDLKVGKSEKIKFTLSASDLASFDVARSSWVVEPGTYTVKIGNSSKNISQTATFTVANEILVEKVHNVLAPVEEFAEISKNN